MAARDKPLMWLHGEIRTPPLSAQTRIEAGVLLRRLQQGHKLSLPHSRPMPVIGHLCHELRITDANATWRLVYRIVFSKKTPQTSAAVIEACRRRVREYDDA
jgi:phage-related protein